LSVLGKSWKSVRIWIILDFKDLYSLSVKMQLISKISIISAVGGGVIFHPLRVWISGLQPAGLGDLFPPSAKSIDPEIYWILFRIFVGETGLVDLLLSAEK
jgi:hypothetical protein